MSNNKKGFTLVELIAVILLLSILITISILSISSIRYKVGQRQYLSLAKVIEAEAEGYYNETGATKFLVQNLIDLGLLEVDDETKKIYDPRDKSRSLNCSVIDIDSDGHAILNDENKDDECDINLLNNAKIKIKYCLESEVVCEPKDLPADYNHWFKDNVILSVEPSNYASGLSFDKNTSYTWISPLAPDNVYNDSTLKITGSYINETFQVTVHHQGQDYRALAPIRIDRVPPKVFDLIDRNPQSWSKTKYFSFKLSDNESGLDSYAFGTSKDKEPTGGWHQVPASSSKEYVVNDDTGKYTFSSETGNKLYIWVKDRNGNTNINSMADGLGSSITVNNVDLNIDNVSVSADYSRPYFRQEIKLTGKAQDTKSGLIAYAFTNSASEPASNQWTYITGYNAASINGSLKEESFKYSVKSNGTYYFWVKDGTGNVKAASINVDNIDKEIDAISNLRNTQSEWVTQTRLTGTISDNKSGVVAYAFTNSTSAPSSNQWHYLSGYNASSLKGKTRENIDVSGYATALGYWYLWVKDAAGNVGFNGQSVYVANVGRQKTGYIQFNSRSGSTITNYLYDSNIKDVLSVTVNNGYVYNSSYNNNSISVTVAGGSTYTGYETNYYTESSRRYDAHYTTSCSRYSCPSGGVADSSGYCQGNRGSSYELRGSTYTVTCRCPNGYYACTDPGANTSCDPGYKKGSPYNCQVTSSIRNGQKCSGPTSFSKYCYAQCTWQRYRATCSSTRKDYYCSGSDYLSGSSCYYCNRGNIVNYGRSCQYSQLDSYSYWNYTATVTYIVSP